MYTIMLHMIAVVFNVYINTMKGSKQLYIDTAVLLSVVRVLTVCKTPTSQVALHRTTPHSAHHTRAMSTHTVYYYYNVLRQQRICTACIFVQQQWRYRVGFAQVMCEYVGSKYQAFQISSRQVQVEIRHPPVVSCRDIKTRLPIVLRWLCNPLGFCNPLGSKQKVGVLYWFLPNTDASNVYHLSSHRYVYVFDSLFAKTLHQKVHAAIISESRFVWVKSLRLLRF